MARYADHLVAMKAGRVVAEGPPSAVVTAELVREVFGLDSIVIPDPVTGSPLVVPGAPWSASRPSPGTVHDPSRSVLNLFRAAALRTGMRDTK